MQLKLAAFLIFEVSPGSLVFTVEIESLYDTYKISLEICQWENLENRSTFVHAMILFFVSCSFIHTVHIIKTAHKNNAHTQFLFN